MYGQKQYGQATTVLTLAHHMCIAQLGERFIASSLSFRPFCDQEPVELAPLALLWRLLVPVHSEMALRWSPFLPYLCHRRPTLTTCR